MSAITKPAQPLLAGAVATSRQQVVDLQRARILAAAAGVVEDLGYLNLSATEVIGRAKVSRRTFYEIFENREECFEAVIEQIIERAYEAVRAAVANERSWRMAVRAGLNSLLWLIEEESGLARIWFVDGLSGPSRVVARQAQTAELIVGALYLGPTPTARGRQPAELAVRATVGGISHIIHTRLVSGSHEPFSGLLGPLMYMIMLPYVGAARATAELRRKPMKNPHPPKRRSQSSRGSLRGLKMRLTYRTVGALSAIWAEPGASNRMVAAGCGVRDQGQISKLLTRLERLELIENRGGGHDLGGSNAWHLTKLGHELVRATRGAAHALPPGIQER